MALRRTVRNLSSGSRTKAPASIRRASGRNRGSGWRAWRDVFVSSAPRSPLRLPWDEALPLLCEFLWGHKQAALLRAPLVRYMSLSKPRVLLADDHRILAEGLRSLLEPEFEVVGVVADGRELVGLARKLRPDVIVADVTM